MPRRRRRSAFRTRRRKAAKSKKPDRRNAFRRDREPLLKKPGHHPMVSSLPGQERPLENNAPSSPDCTAPNNHPQNGLTSKGPATRAVTLSYNAQPPVMSEPLQFVTDCNRADQKRPKEKRHQSGYKSDDILRSLIDAPHLPSLGKAHLDLSIHPHKKNTERCTLDAFPFWLVRYARSEIGAPSGVCQNRAR